MRALSVAIWPTLSLPLVLLACGGGDEPPVSPIVPAGTGGSPADAGFDASGGEDAAVEDARDAEPTDSSDVAFNYDTSVPDGFDPDRACVVVTQSADPIPLSVYIMVDRSGSMGPDCDVGEDIDGKWCGTVNAIAGFVDALAPGSQVALEYFPSAGGMCDGLGYDDPAVPLGELPAHSSAIVDSLNNERPGGGTPTEGALRGLVGFTSTHSEPGLATIGILITDGTPTTCDRDVGVLASIPTGHFIQTGIPTFLVGMVGANFADLEGIAVGSGAPLHDSFCGTTPPCHHYSVADGDPQAFIQALGEIRQTAIECQYQMPQPATGIVDPDEVEVEYTAGGSGSPVVFPRVWDDTECVTDGWYYDDNANPTTINLCPVSCGTVLVDINPIVELSLGCLGS